MQGHCSDMEEKNLIWEDITFIDMVGVYLICCGIHDFPEDSLSSHSSFSDFM